QGADRPAAVGAPAPRGAPPEPGLRDVPLADGSARLRARAFRCGRRLADRGRWPDGGGCQRCAAERRQVRRADGPARAVAHPQGTVCVDSHRTPARVRGRARRRVLRSAGGSGHPARRRGQRLHVERDRPRRRPEHAVPDAENRIMMVTRRAIPRRTILRGLGASFALPLLDSMLPAFTATAASAAQPALRFGVVYVPNGMVMQEWTPKAEGAAFELLAAMKPLEARRDRLTVLTGLASMPPVSAATGAGVHARASTRFLTDIHPKRSDTSEVLAGVSAD